MPKKRYWKKRRTKLRTDMTEDSGLYKNRSNDMDLTEDPGLHKNRFNKTFTIDVTEDPGLLDKNRFTKDCGDPASLKKQVQNECKMNTNKISAKKTQIESKQNERKMNTESRQKNIKQTRCNQNESKRKQHECKMKETESKQNETPFETGAKKFKSNSTSDSHINLTVKSDINGTVRSYTNGTANIKSNETAHSKSNGTAKSKTIATANKTNVTANAKMNQTANSKVIETANSKTIATANNKTKVTANSKLNQAANSEVNETAHSETKRKQRNSERDHTPVKQMRSDQNALAIQVSNRQFVFGSFNQADPRFSTFSRGSQCTCMSLMMLVQAKTDFAFTTAFIDNVLFLGDNLYNKVAQGLILENKFLNKLLLLDELPNYVSIGDHHFRTRKHEVIYGLAVTVAPQDLELPTLQQSLQTCFSKCNFALVMIGGICSAVYQAAKNQYFFFDSHSHGSNGMSACDGKAVLVQCSTLDDIVAFLYAFYMSLHLDLSSQIEVLPVAIERIVHAFLEIQSSNKQSQEKPIDHACSKDVSENETRKRYMRKYMSKLRENKEFKQTEQEKELASKRSARQNEEFRQREQEKELAGKRSARRNEKFRQKEQEKDSANRRSARQNKEFRQKEQEKELASKRSARQNKEFRQKEQEKDSASRRSARQNKESRQKEQEKELASKRSARQNKEFRQKEQEKDSASRRSARQNKEYRQKEQEKELASKRSARQNQEFRQKEREKDSASRRSTRQNKEFRNKEQQRELKCKQTARKNVFVQEKERISKQQKRRDAANRIQERQSDLSRRRRERSDPEYCEKEKSNAREKRFGANVKKCIDKFHDNISEGPIYVCTSCQQTWFKGSVSEANNALSVVKNVNCFTGCKSVGNKEWLCHTCSTSLKDGKIPKLSNANGMKWPEKPTELNLHPLEERLVSLRIPFMQIRELPRGGQYSAKGNVVNVPVDIQPTISMLPRQMDENFTIAVQLKKRLSFRSHQFKENVRPAIVLAALHWLMNKSDLYKNSGIQVDNTWLDNTSNSAEEIVREFTGNISQSDCTLDTRDVENTDNFIEVDSNDNVGNPDTLIEDANVDTNKIYTFAPGEDQRPLSLYEDQDAEYLSFPSLFCGQKRPDNKDRYVQVHYSDIAKWELRSIDRRAAQSVPNIFFKLKKIQLKQVSDKVNLAVRRCQKKGKKINAAEARDPATAEEIVKLNEGYYIFRTLRNSPAYLEAKKKEAYAMIRQLGLPTWFMSLSSADTRWNDLLKILAKLNLQKEYSDEEVENLTWKDKTELVQKDPVTCSRYFDHRVQEFLKTILKSDHHPIGKFKDSFHRVEFQQRGSPHIHMVVWIENAPKYQQQSENEILEFVEQYITCSGKGDDEEMDKLIERQVHKHSKTCKKKDKVKCRFGFPQPPLNKTMLLEPLDVEVEKYRKMYVDLQKKLNEFKDGLDISYQEFLQQVVQLPEEDYIKCIRSSLKGPKVFLKRQPSEMRVNNYNGTLLCAWKANLDIQFILDPYACVMYIVSYMSKSQRGISAILDQASKEAREGNMDLKRQVRHIGNKFLNFVEVSAQEACYLVLQMPLTRSSRDVIFINTSQPDDRVFLLKSKAELDNLPAHSTDVEVSNVIQRYSKRPKQLENWCLADYVVELDIIYPEKETMTNKIEQENQVHEVNEDDCVQDDELDDDVDEFSSDDTILTLKNGIVIKKRKNPKVIRYVRFNKRTDSENYFRERLILFYPWRKEDTDILGGFQTYEQHYGSKRHILDNKANRYEHHTEELDIAQAEAERDLEDYDVLVPNVQQVEAEDELQGIAASDKFMHFNPDSVAHTNYDIGPEVGLPPQPASSTIEASPARIPDHQYFELLRSLNKKQREFFNHVIHWLKTKDDPIYAYLSGGAGVGKSVVIRALYQMLHRYLSSAAGESPDDIRVLLCAYTGKAAYNIDGSTIASAFHKKMYQPQQHMHPDELNTFRTKYRNLSVIIIDEISMVGNKTFTFMNERLQELTCTKRDFGGISIIAVGDLYQLPPISESWIFNDLSMPGQGLASNLWKNHFEIFELTEIMRQRDDLHFANLLNRLRRNNLTDDDRKEIEDRCTNMQAVNYPINVPHIFTENKFVDNFNNNMMMNLHTQKICVQSDTDVITPTKLNRDTREKLLNSLPDDASKTGQLANKLTIAVGMIYDITVNVDVSDGLANGSTCVVKHIEFRKESPSRPAIIWVHFTDTKIGNNRRNAYKHLYSSGIQSNWTPVFETKRSFLFNRKTFIRIQFPLKASAAKTIHKAQGSTVDELVVDLSQTRIRKIPHIHYVALSRVRSLQNLHILNFNEQALKVDEKVEAEMNRLKEDAPLTLCYKPVYTLQPCSLTVIFNNARSFHKHYVDIKADPNILASDILCFAESRLASRETDQEYNIDGFDLVRNDQQTTGPIRPFHGLLMYTKRTRGVVDNNCVKYSSDDLEFIFKDISVDGMPVQLVVLYKSPSCPLHQFKRLVCSHLVPLVKNNNLILLGDFNFDLLAGNAEFLSFMQRTFTCTQYVQPATTDYSTKLDLIFSTCKPIQCDAIEAYWSDHKMIYCALNFVTHD